MQIEAWPTEPTFVVEYILGVQNLVCFSVGGLGHRFWYTLTLDHCTCSSIISH